MKDKCVCFNCGKEFEFDWNDTQGNCDENSDGDVNYWQEIFCPNCNNWTAIN